MWESDLGGGNACAKREGGGRGLGDVDTKHCHLSRRGIKQRPGKRENKMATQPYQDEGQKKRLVTHREQKNVIRKDLRKKKTQRIKKIQKIKK